MHTAAPRRGHAPLRRMRPHKQHSSTGVIEDVGHFVGGQMEVDRHDGGAADEPTQVGHGRFDGVFGKDRDAALRPQVQLLQAVRHPIQAIIDLSPT